MATKIIHKKSSVAEKVPLTTDLEIGELAINLVDKKLFSKDGNGNIIEFGSVEVQQLTVYNGTGATIPKGSAVYINGAQGQRPSIALASNASEATSSKTIGFVNADILNGAEGVVTTEGLVYNLNTAAFTEGGAIYLGATAGSITQTKPVAPAHLVSLGWVVKAHASSGRILAHVQNGFELNELHDVLITSPANTQVLAYETSTGLWKNSNLDWANVQNKPDPVITLAGDLSGSVTLTDLASGTLTATIAANSVALGTDTTGNYVATVAAGTSGAQTSSSGLTISATAGEGTAATIAHADTSTAANLTASGRTYVTGLTFDTYGHVTAYTTGAETVTDTNTTSLPIENSAGTVQFTATDTTGLQFVGSGATTVAFDAANSRVTISSTDTNSGGTVTSVSGTAPIVSSGGTTPAISITAATTSAAGSMSAADKTKLDGIATSANNYSLPAATSTALGGIELFSDTAQTVAANTVSTTAGRTYGLQANGSGQGVVNVPWTDTNTTSLPIKNSAGVTQITVTDTTGLQFVGSGTTNVAFDSPNSRVTISSTDYTLPAASSTTRGGVELFSDTIQTTAANATSQTASRTYGVQVNSDAQLVVNVPWTDTTSTYTLPAATSTALGGIELASDTVQTVAAEAVSATASRTYGVQVNSAGQAVVNVPWVDTNSGGNALTSNTLAQFAATTSAQLAGVISDETGSGALVFGTSPSFTTGINAASATMSLFDTTATTVHAFGAATTGNLGYDGTAASTTNISIGANTSGVVKAVNIGTGGVSGSTTNITLGSTTAGALGNTTVRSSSLIVPNRLAVGADMAANTGPILTLGTITNNGSGLMNGTHTNQAFVGGSGSGMLGTVTVALGVVTGITLTWGGHKYLVGDVLTMTSLSTALATTAISGNGTTVTITFATQAAAPFEVGSQIFVSGVTPTGYNGTFTVTACTTTSVSYANATTGAQTVAGTVKMGSALTSSTIPVATIQGANIYVNSYTSDSIGARIRLESNDTSIAAGQEYGAITFSGRDASINGSGDLALIRGVGVGTSGGSDLQFWTAANGAAPTPSAVITSGGDFRLYNAAGTFYSELSNNPTANRTVTIPDGTGTLVFDTSPSFTTGINAASTTMALFDTTATTVNAFGATTTLNLGYDGTAQSTTNISTGVVASGVPKTVNIGTGGSGASTTNINIGANDNGGLTINSSAVNAPNANLTAYTLAADYIDANAGVMQIHAPAGFGAQLNFYPDASTYGWSINAETDNTISFYSQTPNEAVFRVGAAGQIGVGVVTDYGTAGQVLTSGGTAGEASWTTLPTATSTVKGVVELFSDTVQTVAANAVTATASRTYGIQLNAANQMVVNVPWTSGAPTTAEVGTATAGLAVGDVGSYALLWHNTTAAETPGTTAAGSTLRYANTTTDATNPLVGYGATAPAGTWRIMGHTAVQGGGTAFAFSLANVSVWLRIS